ncbi:MAG TPA: NAD(P)-dependent alcohol dehydrogenase [Planctomycetota bacterium]|nr:NAD(P)-dependent alcohol dehydrogenase [Planctomycetota bacterium]
MTTLTADVASHPTVDKNPTPVPAYGVSHAAGPLAPLSITRREPRPTDVEIEILYCGVCHSDLHTARDEWRNAIYPCVPGHEIVGRVTRVGGDVAGFAAGDLAAVGCMVDSCRGCEQCGAGLEQYCPKVVLTYNSPDPHLGGHTYGGYARSIVVDEAFVLRVPPGMDLAATAPLLCAGITTWSPLRHWKVGPGQKVGVVGLGGLGHMGIKFARAFGAHVVLFTTSPRKTQDALALGAHEVVVSSDGDAMRRHHGTFHLILDTVSAPHDINAYLAQLKVDATLVTVGAPYEPLPTAVFSLILGRRRFAGSAIGGIAETQEMLDFCGEHGIASDVEVIPMQRINEAWERMLRQDVRYRFVIDMASLKA